MTTQNRYDTGLNYVVADQPPAPIDQTSLIRRNDVMQAVGGVIEAYRVQQSALLDSVTGETVQGRGFLSDAGQVAERRKTSGMYLLTYGTVAAMTTGGLSYMATLAGMDGALSIAGWLFATGALTLALAWHRHGDEFKHSPEGIARHVIDAHWDVAGYESETRRLSLQWEHEAEGRRQAAQERAAEHGRQLAQLRVDELDARRRTIEAQTERRMYAESPSAAIAGVGRTEAALQVQSIDDAPTSDSSGSTADGWQAALVTWVASLYDAGAITDAGVIRGRVPWAARSPWVDADKAESKRVCTMARPALIEPTDGGRWRLRVEVFTDVDQALQVLQPRLS